MGQKFDKKEEDEYSKVAEALTKYSDMLKNGAIINENESTELKNCLSVVTFTGEFLPSDVIPPFFYENKQGAEYLIDSNPNFWSYLTRELKKDSDLLFKALRDKRCNCLAIAFYSLSSEILKSNENTETLLELLGSAPSFLELKNSSNKRKNSKHSIVFSIYEKLSNEQKLNKDLAIKFLELDAHTYSKFPNLIKMNEEVISVALKNDSMTLKYMPVSVKSDRNIVSNCIEQNPMSLGFAVSELKADRILVMKAVRLDPKTINVSHGKIRENKMLFKILLSRCMKEDKVQVLKMMEHMHQKFRSDSSIMLQGAQREPRVLYYMSDSLRSKVKKIANEMFGVSNIDELHEALKVLNVYEISKKERQSLQKDIPLNKKMDSKSVCANSIKEISAGGMLKEGELEGLFSKENNVFGKKRKFL